MSAKKKSTVSVKAKKTVKKKKTAVASQKKQQTVSERLQDRNVQAGIVAILLAFTFLLLLVTYFTSH